MTKCETCDGKKVCPRCGGTQQARSLTGGMYALCKCKNGRCWGCDGSGRSQRPAQPCRACGGNRLCAACHGSGQYRSFGRARCNKCSSNSGKCSTCGGTGVASKS